MADHPDAERMLRRLRAPFQGTLGEIDFFSAGAASVNPVEFIGKNFLFLAALRAGAGKGLQVLELFVSRTMLRCGHDASFRAFIILKKPKNLVQETSFMSVIFWAGRADHPYPESRSQAYNR
jgi:hypothetical protein